MSVNFGPSQRRLDGWQQRRIALAIPVAVIKKFVDLPLRFSLFG